MLKSIVLSALGIFVAAVIVLGLVINMQPDEYKVERSATIDAPVDIVFSQVNDFRNWEHWSPWAESDPDMETTYSGSEQGEGAVMEWKGSEKSGSGRMTMTESRPNDYIEIELVFIEPFESETTTAFDFQAQDNQTTTVTWSMSGENNFVSKAFGLFMDMEDMIGDDYEKGLANLNEAVRNASD